MCGVLYFEDHNTHFTRLMHTQHTNKLEFVGMLWRSVVMLGCQFAKHQFPD